MRSKLNLLSHAECFTVARTLHKHRGSGVLSQTASNKLTTETQESRPFDPDSERWKCWPSQALYMGKFCSRCKDSYFIRKSRIIIEKIFFG